MRLIFLTLVLVGYSWNAPGAGRSLLVFESWSRAKTTQPLDFDQRIELLICRADLTGKGKDKGVGQ